MLCAVVFRYGHAFVPTSVVPAATATFAPVWKAVPLVAPVTVKVAAVGMLVVTRPLTAKITALAGSWIAVSVVAAAAMVVSSVSVLTENRWAFAPSRT